MNRHLAVSALLVALCLPSTAPAQTPQAATPDRPQVIKAARDVMQKARFCTLVTVGEDGHPQARVVDPFLPEDDMTVWLATNPVTRKVAQIRKDPRVTLLYFDAGGHAYVTVLGRAELVRDPAESKHWKEEWAPLYKDKSRGDDYLLIRVRPTRLEIVSDSHGLSNDPQTWRPVVLDLR